MQTYHSSWFLQQNKILTNTAHIALNTRDGEKNQIFTMSVILCFNSIQQFV